MKLDCILFDNSTEPRKISVRENLQDVSFSADGEYFSRRVSTFNLSTDDNKTTYLIAVDESNPPNDHLIIEAIERLQPNPYEG